MDKATLLFEKLAAYDTSLLDYWDYGKNLIRHKKDVYQTGRQLNIPRWPLITHDIDKFYPARFKPYAEWFFGPQGYYGSANSQLKEKWLVAVKKHKKAPHHQEIKSFDTELESVADWYAASKREVPFGAEFPDFRTWVAARLNSFDISDMAKSYIKTKLTALKENPFPLGEG